MAGSYGHVDLVDGRWSLVEDMGDANETVEELLWLVAYFAGRASNTESIDAIHVSIRRALDTEYYPQARRERPPDGLFAAVQAVMQR